MRIVVHVKPNAKHARISKIGEKDFKIHVKEPAHEGKANDAVIRAVADHFRVALRKVSIISGKTSKTKLIEIS